MAAVTTPALAERARIADKPAYEPLSYLAVWLSSHEVRDALRAVAEQRDDDMWLACCLRHQQELERLVEREHSRA